MDHNDDDVRGRHVLQLHFVLKERFRETFVPIPRIQTRKYLRWQHCLKPPRQTTISLKRKRIIRR
jgi:hypothetical protein